MKLVSTLLKIIALTSSSIVVMNVTTRCLFLPLSSSYKITPQVKTLTRHEKPNVTSRYAHVEVQEAEKGIENQASLWHLFP